MIDHDIPELAELEANVDLLAQCLPRWRPISEAPTDDSLILVAHRDGSKMLWNSRLWWRIITTSRHGRGDAAWFLALDDLPPLPTE